MFYGLTKFLIWLPCSIAHPTFIYGKKNMPKGKAILCCNHRSNFDIVSFLLHVKEHPKILAKKELFKNKFFGALLKDFGAIPIDRGSTDVNAIKECMKTLKENRKLFIFPEGTRLKDESQIMGEIKSGTTMIAIKTKTPVVPIFLMQQHKAFRKTQFVIGEPFEFTEFYGQKLDEETLERANNILKDKMLQLYYDNKDRLIKKKKTRRGSKKTKETDKDGK